MEKHNAMMGEITKIELMANGPAEVKPAKPKKANGKAAESIKAKPTKKQIAEEAKKWAKDKKTDGPEGGAAALEKNKAAKGKAAKAKKEVVTGCFGFPEKSAIHTFAMALANATSEGGLRMAEVKAAKWNAKQRTYYHDFRKLIEMKLAEKTTEGKMALTSKGLKAAGIN